MNKQLEKVVDAWPVLSAVAVIVFVLLAAFAKAFIVDVIETDISKTDKIITMDRAIKANHTLAVAIADDTEDIKASQIRMDAKLDRLIEIMLTED